MPFRERLLHVILSLSSLDVRAMAVAELKLTMSTLAGGTPYTLVSCLPPSLTAQLISASPFTCSQRPQTSVSQLVSRSLPTCASLCEPHRLFASVMSLLSTHKRRLSSGSDEDDEWSQASRRQRFSPSSLAATQAVFNPFNSAYFATAGLAASPSTAAPILPRITHFSRPASPPPSFQRLLPYALPPQPAPASPSSHPNLLSSFSPVAPLPARPFPPQPPAIPPVPRFASLSASADAICVDEDDGTDVDLDLARAIAASMAEANGTAAVPPASSSAASSSSSPQSNPPSPSNSVIFVDMDDENCQVIDPSFLSTHCSSSSSAAYLPLSPSSWGRLPADLLALISTFQFGCVGVANGQGYDEEDGSMHGVYGGGRHGRVVPPMRGVMQLASRPAVQGAAEMRGRPDDSILAVRLLHTMSAVCRHWHAAIKPPVQSQWQWRPSGCRVVDCWSGVQQLEMKQSGKHFTIGGVHVKRRHVARVLASMTRLRFLHLEFNVHPSAVDDSDFDHLMPGATVAGFYTQLQQLTIRFVQNIVPHRRKRKGHSYDASVSPQHVTHHKLYVKLSTWLDVHPKLRSFALIDSNSTLPVPFVPFGIGGPMALMARQQAFRQLLVARQPVPFPLPLINPPPFPPGVMPVAPFAAFPAAVQPVYRRPIIPQPTAAALRLLCTGRVQHLALGGETLIRLAYGDEDEKEEKERDEAGQCFRAEEVQSITLLGDFLHTRYVDALHDALPSLAHLAFSLSQSSAGADQILARVGQRVTSVRGSITSVVGLSLPATSIKCTALQSLYIYAQHMPTELARMYAALPSLPSLTQLSVVEQQQPGMRYPIMHNLPELFLPPLPQLSYLHLQLSSYRAFPLVANRNGPPSAILPAQLTHLLLSIPGQQLVPHLSSVPVLCPKLSHCHINSGASVTAQTWETRLGRLKARLRGVWCDSEIEVTRHRLDVGWRASVDVKASSGEEWEGSIW